MDGVCDVCLILDNDSTIKDVEYCNFCQAFICVDCKPSLYRRGLAMLKQKKDAKNKSRTNTGTTSES